MTQHDDYEVCEPANPDWQNPDGSVNHAAIAAEWDDICSFCLGRSDDLDTEDGAPICPACRAANTNTNTNTNTEESTVNTNITWKWAAGPNRGETVPHGTEILDGSDFMGEPFFEAPYTVKDFTEFFEVVPVTQPAKPVPYRTDGALTHGQIAIYLQQCYDAGVEPEELDDSECMANTCGHVDTNVVNMHHHGFMTPMDWAAIQDTLLHALGVIDEAHCYRCYLIEEERRYELDQRRGHYAWDGDDIEVL